MKRTLALVVLALLPFAASAQVAPALYSLTEIGDFPGGADHSEAWDVNDLGQVVGGSEAATGGRGFLWDNGSMTKIGDLPTGGDYSIGRAINNLSQVAGYSSVETTPNDQFQIPRLRPILWENGILTNLGRLPTGQFHARGYGINESGQVGGESHASPGHTEAVRIDTFPSIVMVPMNTHLAEDRSKGFGINEAGQIPGYSNGHDTPEAVVWNANNSITPLGDLPGGTNHGEGRGINDSGHVVGWSDAATGQRAFLWQSGIMTNLGDLPGGDDSSWAWAISNQGLVVGYSGTTGGDHAFVWSEAAGMQDLNSLLDATGDGWTLTEARGLNELGQIVGVGVSPRGATRGFLLTPTFHYGTTVLDHIATPAVYDNAGGSFTQFWGQTFTSQGWNIVGFDVFIGDPTRPNEVCCNELEGAVDLLLYDASDFQNPVLLASRTQGTASSVLSGLVSFDLSQQVSTEAGRLYLFALRADDNFGIGLRNRTASTYQDGAEVIFKDGEILPPGGRDLSFRIRRADTDGDGIPDDYETDTGSFVSPEDTGTDPNNGDSDGDGLRDGEEVLIHGTDPNIADTDGDGLGDGAEVAYAGNESTYELIQVSLLWDEARADAESKGGQLATFETGAELDAALLVIRDSGFNREFWIGLSDVETEGVWKWLDGTETSFTRWHAGEPNGDRGDNYACVTIEGWNDCRNSDRTSAYLLERMQHLDPLSPDTDGDGVPDGQEIADGTDPTDADSVTLPPLFLDPVSASADSLGETLTFEVTSIAGTSWRAESLVPWITINGSTAGTGNGTISYTVDPNSETDLREGQIKVTPVEESGEWETTIVDDPISRGSLGNESSLAFGPGGYPVIAYGASATTSYLRVAQYDGDEWTIAELAPTNNQVVSSRNSITFSPEGNPAVSFNANEGGQTYSLRFAERVNGVWLTETVPTSESVSENSLTFDASGSPVIAYVDAERVLNVTRKIGGTWQTEQIANDARRAHVTILQTSSSHLAIAYITDSALKFATNETGQWVSTTIADGTFYTASMSRSPNGSLAVTFGGSSRTVMLATQDGNSWNTQVVTPGQTPTLSFGPDGLPVILYKITDENGLMVNGAVGMATTNGDTWATEEILSSSGGNYSFGEFHGPDGQMGFLYDRNNPRGFGGQAVHFAFRAAPQPAGDPVYHTVTQLGIPTFELTVGNLTNGSITGNEGTYDNETIAHLTATPSPGFFFAWWTGDTSGNTNPLSLLMDQDRTVGAVFAQDGRDSDQDGLSNYQEVIIHGTDPDNPDTDGDGVSDGTDVFPLDSSEDSDTDGDGIGNNADPDDDNDGHLDDEDTFPLDPLEWTDNDDDGLGDNADLDDDNDGFLDGQDAFPLDPTEWLDTDGDGIGNNADPDDDNDGINDEAEGPLGTDPLLADTDGDGLGDGDEIRYSYDPTNPDTNGDGIPDGLDDSDEDGLTAAQEIAAGTSPRQADTDGDGLNDPDELNLHGTDPTNADTDGDLLEDGVELNLTGTDPLLADTDGNGTSDGDEDPDRDRYTNLQEVEILLTDPLDGTSKFTFEFVRTATEHSITFTAMRGRRYKVERSIDLNEWSEVISFVGSGSAVTVPLGPPFSQRWFYRVVVTVD